MSKLLGGVAMTAVVSLGVARAQAEPASPRIQVHADTRAVEMGRSVGLQVSVQDADGAPLPGCLLLTYVNERRWGAHEVTGACGNSRIILPLPNPGPARVVVRAVPGIFDTCWIWTPNGAAKAAYLARRLALPSPPSDAGVRVAATETCTVLLNGTAIGQATGTNAETRLAVPAALLRAGDNLLAIEASNSAGMAGVAAQFRVRCGDTEYIVATGSDWQAWEERPEGWPAPAADSGVPVRVLARLWDGLLPAAPFESWPGNICRDDLFAGRVLPREAVISNPIAIEVRPRPVKSRRDPEHLIGMQWGSYFFPGGFYWQTAQAVPLVGFYDTGNPDVIRQQALWLMDLGVDFLIADWPIYIAPDADGKQRWGSRNDFGKGLVRTTTAMLEGLAQLRDEGFPVPAMVIMAYLVNGPPNSTEVANEELEWLHENFIGNPRFHGLWVIYKGKPLVTLLYCAGAPASELPGPPIDTTHFTVRYVSTQLQRLHTERYGYWSWMDGSVEPVVTFANGSAEAVTPTPACFGLERGWRGDDAFGRRNGATFIRSFRPALEHRPRFVVLHQWNEFTGQPEGYPYENGIYGDSYSVELSDDIEPVSLTATGYRRDRGGWGFYYVNLAQALVSLLKQPAPEDSVLAMYSPSSGQMTVRGKLPIAWELAGKAAASFSVLIDGITVAEGIQGSTYALDTAQLAPGKHVATLVAEGAVTHYRLSHDRWDSRLDDAIPARADMTFVVE